jgi:predicted Ser/Thr protein kinase
MILGPKDLQVSDTLGKTDEERQELLEVFETAWKPWGQGISSQQLSDAYTAASYFYAVSKDVKRRSRADGEGLYEESTMDAQAIEDYMEGLVKALDKALMVSLSLARHGGA